MPDQRETLVRKMVAEGLSDEDITSTLKVYDTQTPTAAKSPPAERGALSQGSDFLPTVGGAIGGIAGGIPGAALGGAAGEGYRQLAEHATELPGAIADIARNIAGGHGLESLKGFNQGATEGGLGAATEGAIQGALTGAVGLAGKAVSKAPGLVVGGLRMAGVPIPAGVARIVGMLPRGVKAAAAQASEHVPTAAGYETAQQAASRMGQATPTRIARGMLSAEHAAATPTAEAAVNASRAVPRATATETPLPQAWRQFAKLEGATVPKGTAPDAGAKPQLTIDDFGGLSSWEKQAIRAEQEAHGLKPVIKAHEAADYLRTHGSMIPPGTTASRAAQHLSDAQMNARYRHLLETGAADPRLLATMGAGVTAPPAMKALLDYLGGGSK